MFAPSTNRRRGRGHGRSGRAAEGRHATGPDDGACPRVPAATGVPASAWAVLDMIDLQLELRRLVPTLQDLRTFLTDSCQSGADGSS